MPKLIFTTSTFDLGNFKEREVAEQCGYELVLNPYGKRLTETQIKDLLTDDVVGMVAGLEPLTESVISNAKGLKVISRCGIGLDNVDLAAAQKKGVSVFNTPDAPTKSVAELTIAHILSLARRISESDRMARSGTWQPLMGSLVSKQTVGIIGLGRIGKVTARLLNAFGARILAYDMFSIAEEGIEMVSLEVLLEQSDIITLHVPYSQDTHHIINKEALSKMKPSALLINVARGGLIDEYALLEALQTGKIAGAGLDCFEVEPYNGPLTACENVQITAHMGSYAKEARSMMEAEACEALVSGLRKHGLF